MSYGHIHIWMEIGSFSGLHNRNGIEIFYPFVWMCSAHTRCKDFCAYILCSHAWFIGVNNFVDDDFKNLGIVVYSLHGTAKLRKVRQGIESTVDTGAFNSAWSWSAKRKISIVINRNASQSAWCGRKRDGRIDRHNEWENYRDLQHFFFLPKEYFEGKTSNSKLFFMFSRWLTHHGNYVAYCLSRSPPPPPPPPVRYNVFLSSECQNVKKVSGNECV